MHEDIVGDDSMVKLHLASQLLQPYKQPRPSPTRFVCSNLVLRVRRLSAVRSDLAQTLDSKGSFGFQPSVAPGSLEGVGRVEITGCARERSYRWMSIVEFPLRSNQRRE